MPPTSMRSSGGGGSTPLTPEEQAALEAEAAALAAQQQQPPPTQSAVPVDYQASAPAPAPAPPDDPYAQQVNQPAGQAIPGTDPGGVNTSAPAPAPTEPRYQAAPPPQSTLDAAAAYGGINQGYQPRPADAIALGAAREGYQAQQATTPSNLNYTAAEPLGVSPRAINAGGDANTLRSQGAYGPPPQATLVSDQLTGYSQQHNPEPRYRAMEPSRGTPGTGEGIAAPFNPAIASSADYLLPPDVLRYAWHGQEDPVETGDKGLINTGEMTEALGRALGLDTSRDMHRQIASGTLDWVGDQAAEWARDQGARLWDIDHFLGQEAAGAKKLLIDQFLGPSQGAGDLLANTLHELGEGPGVWLGIGARQIQSTANPTGEQVRETQSSLDPLGAGLAQNVRDPLAAWWNRQPGPWLDEHWVDHSAADARGATNSIEATQTNLDNAAALADQANRSGFVRDYITRAATSDAVDAALAALPESAKAELQRQRGRMLAQQLAGQQPSVNEPRLNLPDVGGALRLAAETANRPPPQYTAAYPSAADASPAYRASRAPQQSAAMPAPPPADLTVGQAEPLPAPPPTDLVNAPATYRAMPPYATAYPEQEPSLLDQVGASLTGLGQRANEAVPSLSLPSLNDVPPDLAQSLLQQAQDVGLPQVTLPEIGLPNLGIANPLDARAATNGKAPTSVAPTTQQNAPALPSAPATVPGVPAGAIVGGGTTSGAQYVKVGDQVVGMMDPDSGAYVSFDGMTLDQMKAAEQDIRDRATAKQAAAPVTAAPGPSSGPAETTTTATDTSTSNSGGSSGGPGSTYTDYSAGGSSGGYRGSARRSYDNDYEAEEPELRMEDFLKDFDGDGSIGNEDRRRAKREYSAALSKRKGRKGSRSRKHGFDPLNRPESPLRTQILDELETNLGSVPARRPKKGR